MKRAIFLTVLHRLFASPLPGDVFPGRRDRVPEGLHSFRSALHEGRDRRGSVSGAARPSASLATAKITVPGSRSPGGHQKCGFGCFRGHIIPVDNGIHHSLAQRLQRIIPFLVTGGLGADAYTHADMPLDKFEDLADLSSSFISSSRCMGLLDIYLRMLDISNY